VERLERSEYQRLYCELAAQWLVLAHEAESDEARVVVVKKESPAIDGANASSHQSGTVPNHAGLRRK